MLSSKPARNIQNLITKLIENKIVHPVGSYDANETTYLFVESRLHISFDVTANTKLVSVNLKV